MSEPGAPAAPPAAKSHSSKFPYWPGEYHCPSSSDVRNQTRSAKPADADADAEEEGPSAQSDAGGSATWSSCSSRASAVPTHGSSRHAAPSISVGSDAARGEAAATEAEAAAAEATAAASAKPPKRILPRFSLSVW